MTEFQMCPACQAKKEESELSNRKKELLAHYASKAPRFFHQWDAIPHGGESITDLDGDDLWMTDTWELRSAVLPVRIQILEGTEKADAIRVLEKMLSWVETVEWSSVNKYPTMPGKSICQR